MTISKLDNRESIIAQGEIGGIPGLAHSVAQESQVEKKERKEKESQVGFVKVS